MAVEVVAVVEVAIAGAGLADGLGDLVDRQVVEGREHRVSWGVGVGHARSSSMRLEQLAAGLVVGHLGGAGEHAALVEQHHHAGHDRGVAGGAQQLVPVEVLGRAAAGQLPTGDGLGPLRQTGQPRHSEGLPVVAVEEQVPGQVLHGVAGGDHLPVEDGGHRLVGREDHVADARVAPAQGRRGVGGRQRRRQQLEGPVDAGVGLVARGEATVLPVELKLLGRRRHLHPAEADGEAVEAVDGPHRVDAAGPDAASELRGEVREPALLVVAGGVRRHLALDAAHGQEPVAQHRRVLLEGQHLGHRHAALRPERLHHLHLGVEGGAREDGVAAGLDPDHQAVRGGAGAVAVVPGGVEQEGLVREPGQARDGDLADLDRVGARLLDQPVGQRGPGGGGVTFLRDGHEPPMPADATTRN